MTPPKASRRSAGKAPSTSPSDPANPGIQHQVAATATPRLPPGFQGRSSASVPSPITFPWTPSTAGVSAVGHTSPATSPESPSPLAPRSVLSALISLWDDLTPFRIRFKAASNELLDRVDSLLSMWSPTGVQELSELNQYRERRFDCTRLEIDVSNRVLKIAELCAQYRSPHPTHSALHHPAQQGHQPEYSLHPLPGMIGNPLHGFEQVPNLEHLDETPTSAAKFADFRRTEEHLDELKAGLDQMKQMRQQAESSGVIQNAINIVTDITKYEMKIMIVQRQYDQLHASILGETHFRSDDQD